MARVLHSVERGLSITGVDQPTGVDILFGSANPGGDSGDQDAAPLGSIYLKTDGTLFQKVGTANSTADWLYNGSSSVAIGKWRPERLLVVTNDTQAAGTRNLTTTPFSDDETPLLTAASFAVNDYIISDADGTPTLLRVSAISSPSVTFVAAASALTAEDTFVAINYLPDSPGTQENRAIVNYNGSVIVKLADIDWNFADGINLAAGYAAVNGAISASDTVNSAIEKLDGNQLDLITLSGVAVGSTHLGTFTGSIIPDSSTEKAALQALETYIETGDQTTVAAITTIQTVGSVLVDDVAAIKWYLHLSEDAAPENVKAYEIFAAHDGNSAADATLVDDTVYAKLKLNVAFNATVTVSLAGSGGAQTLNLRVASSSGGVTARVKKEAVKF